MGYTEMAMGIGMTLGPLITSIIATPFGYAGVFYFFAVFIFFFGMLSVCFLPARLDKIENQAVDD